MQELTAKSTVYNGEMFEHLTTEERRSILLAVRKRFSPEFNVPRDRAVESLALNSLFLGNVDEWFGSEDIVEVLRQLDVPTLHIADIEEALTKLAAAGKLERDQKARGFRYRITEPIRNEILADLNESSRLQTRILRKLYAPVLGVGDGNALAPFFSSVVVQVFSELGAQWTSYLLGAPLKEFLNLARVEEIIESKLKRFGINSAHKSLIKRRTIKFFHENDPDYSQFKFLIGQTLYVAELLGMDGKDFLAEETFRGGRLYLDSSVVICALLSESRHHGVFHELRKICQALDTQLCVSRLTVDEVRAVAAEQERIAPEIYDRVSPSLATRIKSDFFNTYTAMKESNPEIEFASLFGPFNRLTETLQSLGIEVVDDSALVDLEEREDLTKIKESVQAASLELRKRPKFANALRHDAVMFRFLRMEKTAHPKVWLVTKDVSLPRAWTLIEPNGLNVSCFLLDGLLQSISPFMLRDEASDSFVETFSQSVAMQLLPHSRVFDIEDFLLFRDLEIDCKEMDEAHVQEGLLRVKHYVLKGAAYRRKDLEAAAYELQRFFARRKEHLGAWVADREKLENMIAKLNDTTLRAAEAHEQRLAAIQKSKDELISNIHSDYGAQINSLEQAINDAKLSEIRKSKKRHALVMFMRVTGSVLIVVALLSLVTILAVRYGDGHSTWQRIQSFGWFYSVACFIWLGSSKLLLFRNEPLKDVFSIWTEIRELTK
jgi:hypothetical protein